ncbi:MAG: hypothetical protein ACRD3V_24455 [Vicinamibacteria bacterium]
MTTELPEEKESLLRLAASPTLWAAHLLLSYATSVIWCAKLAPSDGSLSTARATIGIYTLIALAAVAVIGWRGFVRHSVEGSTLPHDFDSPADRHRFLGFATLLLSGLSAVSIVYTALAVAFIRSCS